MWGFNPHTWITIKNSITASLPLEPHIGSLVKLLPKDSDSLDFLRYSTK